MGLRPERTARTIAGLVAFIGMVFFLFQRIASAIVDFAGGTVQLGLTRYSNFTGRIAARNFAEDKQLLETLHNAEGLLPVADVALVVLLVFAILCFVIALLGLSMPKQFIHVLVAMRLLKWETSLEEDLSVETQEEKTPKVPIKWVAIVALIVVVLIVVLSMISCQEKVKEENLAEAVMELHAKSALYIDSQKAYFKKTQNIGGENSLAITDSLDSKYFNYKVTASRFVAESKVPLGECPAGTRWSVGSNKKGFFTVELYFVRSTPKDTLCSKLTPDYKNVGRK